MAVSLPSHHRALVLESIEAGFSVQQRATPDAVPGSAVLRIKAAGVLSYHREIYSGDRNYPFPTPVVPGMSAIGRVAVLGADSTKLRVGQLVYFDCVVHSRDDPDALFLSALHEGMSAGSKKLMREVWRDGAFAEYARVPLENCFVLDEARLCTGSGSPLGPALGYSVPELMYLCYLAVPYGGLRDIGLQPGDTIIVCPATGGYGGAGAMVAVAMGARVIAFGRNEKELARLKELVANGTPGAGIETVKMTGDEAVDAAALQAFGPADAVLDFSPPSASKSPHVRSAVTALRRGGRVSLMGFNENPMITKVTSDNITLKGKLMYERDDIVQFIKMLETGRFPRGKWFVDVKEFALEQWKEALDAGADHIGIGKHVVITP